jgi:hypothetical protein
MDNINEKTVWSTLGGCICEGNWRQLVSEYNELIGQYYIKPGTNLKYRFEGLVWGDDDFYFLLCDEMNNCIMLSCVSNIEMYGWDKDEVR